MFLSEEKQKGNNPMLPPYNTLANILLALPRRIDENVDGPLYVNNRCIDCTTCHNFAPETFTRNVNAGYHYVHTQPNVHDEREIENARSALLACPVGAIRIDHTKDVDDDEEEEEVECESLEEKLVPNSEEFPRKLETYALLPEGLNDKVWFVGFHNENTFGATPYIVQGKDVRSGGAVTVMVDTPRYCKGAIRSIESICGEAGPDYLFITHVDDSAGHLEWRQNYPNMKRIFHSGDLGEHNWIGDHSLEHVEILLESQDDAQDRKLRAWTLDGKLIEENEFRDRSFAILHTPGHSPGSISLLFENSILFTGDTLAFSSRENGMSGFPRYGHDLKRQSLTLKALSDLSWKVIAPGHGKYKSFVNKSEEEKRAEIQFAIQGLFKR